MFNNVDNVNEQYDGNAEMLTPKEEEVIELTEDIERADEKQINKHTNTGSNRSNTIPMAEKPLTFIERMFEMIFKHGFFKSICAILIILACVMLWQFVNAINYDRIADRVVQELVEKQAKDALALKNGHAEGSALRLENNPKISKELVKALYELGADRVSILEMHNGKENPTSLPFIYCDMTYEETRDKTPYIADEWEQMNMSKYTFFTYMMQERVFCGKTEAIYGIDKKFASKIMANDTQYLGMIVIKNEVEIGFLIVSFLEAPSIDEHKFVIKLSDYAQELGYLLDLSHSTNTANK